MTSGGSFTLTPNAGRDGETVAITLLTVLQDQSLGRAEWLSALKGLLREDAYATLTDANMTADQFLLGAPSSKTTVETFDTGRILGVHVPVPGGEVYVMLTRDADDAPWLVAWWE